MAKDTQQLHDQLGHWGEHDKHPLADWRREVTENDTRLGYWDWVSTRIDGENNDDALSLESATNEDADRILGLGDQFLEDWAEDAVQGGSRNIEYEQRNSEWETLRPLFVAAPTLLRALRVIAEIGKRADASSARLCSEIAAASMATIARDE
jgi:hypothetical protein